MAILIFIVIRILTREVGANSLPLIDERSEIQKDREMLSIDNLFVAYGLDCVE